MFHYPQVFRLPQESFWEAIVSGGGLEKMNDPDLSSRLAATYSDVEEVRTLLQLENEQELVHSRQREDMPALLLALRNAAQEANDRIDDTQHVLRSSGYEEPRCTIAPISSISIHKGPTAPATFITPREHRHVAMRPSQMACD